VDLLELTGHVDAAGLLQGSDQPAHVKTGRISLNTRTDDVSTKDTVDFDWAGAHLRTRGLAGNLKALTLTLESDVHGTAQP
jgi:lipopolysaccharide export system protein LptC